MSLAQAKGCGRKEGNRERLHDDFHPTPPEGYIALMQHPLVADRLRRVGGKVWEPACGDGVGAQVMESFGFDVVATNLDDRGYGEMGVDFLKVVKKRANIIITNPPFHATTGSAADFLRWAGELGVEAVALLLPSNYLQAGVKRGWLQDKRWRATLKLECAWRMDFTGEGANPMDLSWFIWDSPGQSDRAGGLTKLDILHKPVADGFLSALDTPFHDSTCIGCGCIDSMACLHDNEQPCHWLVEDIIAHLGVCSSCSNHIERWNQGDREIGAAALIKEPA